MQLYQSIHRPLCYGVRHAWTTALGKIVGLKTAAGSNLFSDVFPIDALWIGVSMTRAYREHPQSANGIAVCFYSESLKIQF